MRIDILHLPVWTSFRDDRDFKTDSENTRLKDDIREKKGSFPGASTFGRVLVYIVGSRTGWIKTEYRRKRISD